jgi:hypothetical protein
MEDIQPSVPPPENSDREADRLAEEFWSAAGDDKVTDQGIVDHVGRADVNDDFFDIGAIAPADPGKYDAPQQVDHLADSSNTIVTDEADNPNSSRDPFARRLGEDEDTWRRHVLELRMYV